MNRGEVFTDSAGVTCRGVAIEDLQPGDVFIVGWRSTVTRVERDGDQFRVVCPAGPKGEPAPGPWLPPGTVYPVEVTNTDRHG